MDRLKRTVTVAAAIACIAIVCHNRAHLKEMVFHEVGLMEGVVAVGRGENSLRLIGGGVPRSFETILKTKYGIGVRRVGYCTAPRTRFARNDGYNSVMSAAIRLKFGRDVVQDAFTEATAIERTRILKHRARRG